MDPRYPDPSDSPDFYDPEAGRQPWRALNEDDYEANRADERNDEAHWEDE